MAKTDGGPAFPHSEQRSNHAARSIAGMSLRDYFAGQALSGWFGGTSSLPAREHLPRYAAEFYEMADAMLAEREKP